MLALACLVLIAHTSLAVKDDTGKSFHLQEDCQHIVGKQNINMFMLQKLHETDSFHLRQG
jgi:hypothetical protein